MTDDDHQSTWNCGPLLVAAAGLIEISAGVYLEMDMAAAIGSCLLLQGSLDIVFAIRTALNKTFSWKEYFIEKLISVPFSGLGVWAERLLHEAAENRPHAVVKRPAARLTIAKKVARKVVLVSVRGVGAFAFGEVLRKAKDAITENFREELAAKVNGMFEHEFARLQMHSEQLFRSNPSKAENLISDACDTAVERANKDVNFLHRIVTASIAFLPTVVELGLGLLALDVGDRTKDCVRFATVAAISVAESYRLAANVLRSSHEAISTCCQHAKTCSQAVSQLRAHPATVERCTARFKRRLTAFIVKKVSEHCRRGLMQATAQSFIIGGVSCVADIIGF